MVYAIRAMENHYRGDYGVVRYAIKASDSFSDVEEFAIQMCDELISDEGLEIPWAEEWNINDYEDAIDEQRIYDIWVIPDTHGKSLNVLRGIFCKNPEAFIAEYCETP